MIRLDSAYLMNERRITSMGLETQGPLKQFFVRSVSGDVVWIIGKAIEISLRALCVI